MENYRRAIIAKYEEEKEGIYSSYLSQPSRANLKNLCLLRINDNINETDQRTVIQFLDLQPEVHPNKQIQKINTKVDKFRPIGNLLKGEKIPPKLTSLEIAAFLIDFSPRPYTFFKKKDTDKEDEVVQIDDAIRNPFGNQKNPPEQSNNTKPTGIITTTTEPEDTKTKTPLKTVITILAVFMIVSSGIYLLTDTTPPVNCMIWKEDHYEQINCDTIATIPENGVKAIGLDPIVLEKFKKITPTDTTTFFKNKQPNVWYGPSPEGNYEIFSYHGKHPVTRKDLRPISVRIKNVILEKQQQQRIQSFVSPTE